MDTALFEYKLPPSSIAQKPATPRDSSRLLVLNRQSGTIEHRHFRDLGDYLSSGDLLVANNSRVIPARLHGRKSTGGKVELFLLRRLHEQKQQWECLVRGRKLHVGVKVIIERDPQKTESTHDNPIPNPRSPIPNPPIEATILTVRESGTRTVEFSHPIDDVGEIPLPPYIGEYSGDRERYQTIYSQPEGSAAAPTAGLHFTPELLMDLREKGVALETVTLHVGLDTFKPVTTSRIEDHLIHSESAELSSDSARKINETALQGGHVIAVGTTTTRVLEWAATCAQGIDPYDSSACPWQRTAAFVGNVDLFIRPGYRFRATDALITNFHLPRSSLLMMVSAFVGQENEDIDYGRSLLLETYEIAKQEGYRFYSFGDAMLIL